MINTEFSALPTRETRTWNLVGPKGVTPGNPPFGPIVDEEPADLGPSGGVSHCPFYGKGENAEEPWPRASAHRPPDDRPAETTSTAREEPEDIQRSDASCATDEEKATY